MAGERMDLAFIARIEKRFPLPCGYEQFRGIFSGALDKTKYRKETKIFYSSLKRKNKDYLREEDSDNEETTRNRFMTPAGKKTQAIGQSSTKLTKGDRLNTLRRGAVEVSVFSFEGEGNRERQNTAILGEIIVEEEKLNEIKRTLLFKEDFDL